MITPVEASRTAPIARWPNDCFAGTSPVPAALDRARPVLEVLPGWRKDVTSVRRFEDLPPEAQNYVKYIQDHIGIPIRWISVGPNREAMIHVPSENGV